MVHRKVPVSTLLALCASAVFQLACVIRHGTFHPTAVMLLVAGGILVMAALFARAEVSERWLLAPVLVVVGHAALFALPPPVMAHAARTVTLVPLLAVALALTYVLPVRPVMAHVRFALLVVLVVALALDVFAASPKPAIDVFDFQTQGADDLLSGRDPYATVSVVDTYDPSLHVPYGYPPIELVTVTVARALTGDVRFAMLFAMVLAALAARQAIRKAAPGSSELLQDAPALLLFGGPLTAFVLDQAWVDMLPLAFIATALWALAYERSTLAAVLFGVGFAAKQQFVIGFPLLFLVPGLKKRELVIALGAAAATVLPFFVWDPAALWHANVAYFLHLTPRPDALTLRNLINLRFGVAPGELFGASAGLLAVALVWRRVPRGPSTFLMLVCFVLLLIFATGRLAFTNYYFLLSGIAAIAAAQLSAPARDASLDAGSGAQSPERR